MEWLRGVAIAVSGLVLMFGAGFGGYAIGQIGGYNTGYAGGYEQGYSAGEESGYDQGYIEGYEDGLTEEVGSGYIVLKDPTYGELMSFLEEDKTDEHEYVEGVYTCSNFASELNNNAEENGFRAAYVYMEYSESAHTLAAFDTVDKGLIFIEPQFDDEVVVSVGISFSRANGYREPGYDDIITRFMIIW